MCIFAWTHSWAGDYTGHFGWKHGVWTELLRLQDTWTISHEQYWDMLCFSSATVGIPCVEFFHSWNSRIAAWTRKCWKSEWRSGWVANGWKWSNLSFWILHFCGWHIWAAPVPCRLALHGSGSGTADTTFSLQLGCQGLCQVQSCADMNREE